MGSCFPDAASYSPRLASDSVNVELVESSLSIASNRLSLLYRYWQDKSGSERLPARADIDPIDIPSLLPNVLLIDVQRNPLDLVYRLAGTVIVNWFGQEVRGLRVREFPRQQAEALFNAHASVAIDGVPRRINAEHTGSNGERFKAERIALPLATDGRTPDMLLVGIDYNQPLF